MIEAAAIAYALSALGFYCGMRVKDNDFSPYQMRSLNIAAAAVCALIWPILLWVRLFCELGHWMAHKKP